MHFDNHLDPLSRSRIVSLRKASRTVRRKREKKLNIIKDRCKLSFLSRLRKPRVSSRIVCVFLACDPSRNPLCPSGCWLSTLKPHSSYSKETIHEVVLSTGVYSQSDGLYTGRLRLKGVHGLFWLQVNETIKG